MQEIIDTCDFFLGEGRRLYGQTVPSEMPDKQLFTFRMPVGVAAIITAGNFPVAVPSWYLVPAILCGNAVVWKPAEYSPALGDALAELFHAGGVPGGVLNLVQADGAQTFAGLERALDERLVDKVGFTGSSAVGARDRRAVRAPPAVAVPRARRQEPDGRDGRRRPRPRGRGRAVRAASAPPASAARRSARRSSTSRSTTSSSAGSTSGCAPRPIGDPTQDVLYGPMLHERFAERFEDWLGLIRDHHTAYGSTARGRITADNPRDGFVGDPEAGLFYHPTFVDRRDARGRASTRPRRSGRSSASRRFCDVRRGDGAGQRPRLRALVGDLHDLAARTRSASASAISAGMVSVNNSTSGAEAHLPFGGNGKSGNGSRQSGIWVLDQFTRWQSMNWDYAGKLQKAQMDVVEIEADPDFRLPD